MLLDATMLVTNPEGRAPQNPDLVIGIGVHQTVGVNIVQTEEQERATIRRIDTQHVAQGYGGFGYHGIVFPSGRAYICGGGQRAHVEKRNHELRGWAFSGTFTTEQPTALAWEGMHEALIWERTKPYAGKEVRGHREWTLPGTSGTVCPGVVVPKDWEAFLAPPRVWAFGNEQNGLELRGLQQVTWLGGVEVLAVGDPEGVGLGRIAKNMGPQGVPNGPDIWNWLRRGKAHENGEYDATWSQIEGD